MNILPWVFMSGEEPVVSSATYKLAERSFFLPYAQTTIGLG